MWYKDAVQRSVAKLAATVLHATYGSSWPLEGELDPALKRHQVRNTV